MRNGYFDLNLFIKACFQRLRRISKFQNRMSYLFSPKISDYLSIDEIHDSDQEDIISISSDSEYDSKEEFFTEELKASEGSSNLLKTSEKLYNLLKIDSYKREVSEQEFLVKEFGELFPDHGTYRSFLL